MYSVILLAAMSTTPEVPDFGKRRGGDCGQSDCGGCSSTGGHRGKKHRGHGGCGSTCGHSDGGCGHSCGGCGQACGGCGHSCGGCGQACGGCGQAYSGCDSGCGGCGSGFGGYGTAMPAHHGAPTPAPAETVPAPKPMGALSPTSATLVVTGAADAKVTIGGLESASVADMRVMVSPTLEAGQTYHYDLTAEVNGVKLTQAVTVRAGILTEVTLDFAGKTVAMK